MEEGSWAEGKRVCEDPEVEVEPDVELTGEAEPEPEPPLTPKRLIAISFNSRSLNPWSVSAADDDDDPCVLDLFLLLRPKSQFRPSSFDFMNDLVVEVEGAESWPWGFPVSNSGWFKHGFSGKSAESAEVL